MKVKTQCVALTVTELRDLIEAAEESEMYWADKSENVTDRYHKLVIKLHKELRNLNERMY